MRIRRLSEHSVEGSDPKTFTGQATIVRMDGVTQDPDINIYRVQFQPTARTAWHSHSGPQILIILEGICYLQREGNSTQELSAGDVARIDPGERHWHGASPTGPMIHLAVNIDLTTAWFEQVTDQQYAGIA